MKLDERIELWLVFTDRLRHTFFISFSLLPLIQRSRMVSRKCQFQVSSAPVSLSASVIDGPIGVITMRTKGGKEIEGQLSLFSESDRTCSVPDRSISALNWKFSVTRRRVFSALRKAWFTLDSAVELASASAMTVPHNIYFGTPARDYRQREVFSTITSSRHS